MPGADKRHDAINNGQIASDEPNEFSPPEVLVRFKPGVRAETIERITSSLHDRVEDQIESVPGLEAIDDLDNADAESVALAYRGLPEVEYAEPSYEISVDDAGLGLGPVRPRDRKSVV